MNALSRKTILSIIAITGLMFAGIVAYALAVTPSSDQHQAQVKGAASTSTPVPSAVTLEIFTGSVFIKTPSSDTFTKAVHRQTVPIGSTITTAKTSRAQLVYPGGTVTRLDYETQVKVSQYAQPHSVIVEILQGRIWSRIKKLTGNELYQTESEAVTAVVRGTSYNHGVKTEGYDLAIVLKGTVEITCKKTGSTVVVDQGEMGNMDCENKQTLSPYDITQKVYDEEWVQFNMEQDRELNTRFGAETYSDEPATPTATLTTTRSPRESAGVTATSVNETSTNDSRQTQQAPTATPIPRENAPSATPTRIPVTEEVPTATPTPDPRSARLTEAAQQPSPTPAPTQAPLRIRNESDSLIEIQVGDLLQLSL
jgi:hypothetical protein